MLIARRADTRARADFATWKMMAKRECASALPPEAQTSLKATRRCSQQMPEVAATEATIQLMYRPITGEWAAPAQRRASRSAGPSGDR